MQTQPGPLLSNSITDVRGNSSKWVAILTKPSEAAFEAEKPHVKIINMILWLVIGGAILGLLNGIASLIYLSRLGYIFPSGIQGEIGDVIRGSIGYAIVFPIVYLVFEGIQYVIARALGGTGDYSTQAYLQATFVVPIYIIAGLLSLIPQPVAALLQAVVGIYALYLTTLALKATHHYDTRKAVLTWGILIALLVGLALCAFIIVISTVCAPTPAMPSGCF